jgi:hypothetical protein
MPIALFEWLHTGRLTSLVRLVCGCTWGGGCNQGEVMVMYVWGWDRGWGAGMRGEGGGGWRLRDVSSCLAGSPPWSGWSVGVCTTGAGRGLEG